MGASRVRETIERLRNIYAGIVVCEMTTGHKRVQQLADDGSRGGPQPPGWRPQPRRAMAACHRLARRLRAERPHHPRR
jgi:hypothetical protein